MPSNNDGRGIRNGERRAIRFNRDEVGGCVRVGALREMRPRSRCRPPPPTDGSNLRQCQDYNMGTNDSDKEAMCNPVGGAEIELTKSDKKYRFLLGTVVMNADDGVELNDNRSGVNKSRGKGTESEFGNQCRLDKTEDDDQISYEDNSDCDSFDHEPSSSTSVNRISGILLLIISVVGASIFVTSLDGDVIQESEYKEDVVQKVPYSYKGYKDARIPDDDVAQYGGELFTDLYGIGEHQDNDREGDRGEHSSNQKSTYHEHTGIARVDSLWQQLDGYAEITEPFDAQHELPLFWHVPKSGGNTLQDLLLACYGMIGANEIGSAYLKESSEIETLENGIRYVNVDMSSPAGISNAQERGFGMSGLADVVVTSWLHQAASLFDSDHKGRYVRKHMSFCSTCINTHSNLQLAHSRCFTLLRHPIHRAISLFYYLHDKDPIYKNMSIIEYASSQHSEDNWLVRFLNNELSDVLDERHLDTAKEVLASKCLVGLTEEFTLSFERFDEYFGWSETEFGGPTPLHDRGKCVSRIMNNPDNAQSHPTYVEGDEIWNLLMKRNRYDVSLYEHAIHLFNDIQSNFGERG